jgi:hypothetical protein
MRRVSSALLSNACLDKKEKSASPVYRSAAAATYSCCSVCCRGPCALVIADTDSYLCYIALCNRV